MSYSRDLRQFFLFLQAEGISAEKIEKINRTNVMSYILFLQKSNKSASTVLRNVASLRGFCKYLINQGVVKNDPTLEIETPKIERKLPIILSPEDIANLLKETDGDALKSKRDKAMLEVLYATGIRTSELISLEISDLNLEAMYISCHFMNKDRVIPLGNKAVSSLKIYLEEVRDKLTRDKNNQTLFLNNNGIPMTRQGFWKVVKLYAKRANIVVPITPQIIRHSFAAHMLANGADLNSVKEMLGHSDISSTQVYMKLQKHRLKEVYASAHPRYK